MLLPGSKWKIRGSPDRIPTHQAAAQLNTGAAAGDLSILVVPSVFLKTPTAPSPTL